MKNKKLLVLVGIIITSFLIFTINLYLSHTRKISREACESDVLVRNFTKNDAERNILENWAKEISIKYEGSTKTWSSIILTSADGQNADQIIPHGYVVDKQIGTLTKSSIIYNSQSAPYFLPSSIEKYVEKANNEINVSITIAPQKYVKIMFNRSIIVILLQEGKLPLYLNPETAIGYAPVYGFMSN